MYFYGLLGIYPRHIGDRKKNNENINKTTTKRHNSQRLERCNFQVIAWMDCMLVMTITTR